MIVVDSAEPNDVVRAMRGVVGSDGVKVKEIRVREERMGDFTNEKMSFIVERKTVEDLISSLKDNRLYNQMYKIDKAFSGNKFLVIEGSIWDATINNPKIAEWIFSIRGEAGSVYGFSIIETKNIYDTCQTIKWLDRKCGTIPKLRVENYRSLAKKADPIAATLCTIKGISLTKAIAILKYFKTLNRLARAKTDSIVRVPGIGNTLSKRIWDHFHREADV